jgi:hypothetical protein
MSAVIPSHRHDALYGPAPGHRKCEGCKRHLPLHAFPLVVTPTHRDKWNRAPSKRCRACGGQS